MQCLNTMTAAGANWRKREKVFLVAVAASEYAYTAYAPNGGFHQPITISFPAQEVTLVAANIYSSTLWEIMCMLWVYKVVLQASPNHIQHSKVRHETDMQACFYSVMGIKGNPATFHVVLALRKTGYSAGGGLEAQD